MICFNHNGNFKFINAKKAEQITAIINDYRSTLKCIDENKDDALRGVLGAYNDNNVDDVIAKTKTLKRLRKQRKTTKEKTIAKLRLLGVLAIDIDDFIEDWENYVKYYEEVLF